MSWVKTGIAASTVSESLPRELLLGARTLVLVRAGGSVHALDGICPHLGALLAEGTVDGDRLVCPLHGAAFAVSSGFVLADPFGLEPPEGGVSALRRFATRIESGMVEIEVPDDRSA